MHHAPDPVELSTDPDNMPPRSRLFLVVPKLADTQQIQVGGMLIGVVGVLQSVKYPYCASVVGHTVVAAASALRGLLLARSRAMSYGTGEQPWVLS